MKGKRFTDEQIAYALRQAILRLRVTAEADAGVLARLLGSFQNLNVIPLRVSAELSSTDVLFIQIDISGLPESRVTTIAAKLGQLPAIINAYWHHV